jgi:hypothetical protein
MANALYDKGRESFLKGEISWNSNNIKVCLIDTNDYTVDIVNDQFLSDIDDDAIIATSDNLSSKTTTAGVANAANVVFESVTGDQAEALIIYQDTGTASTSRLIAYMDTATGLPITPNNADILISWSTGSNKIFKL